MSLNTMDGAPRTRDELINRRVIVRSNEDEPYIVGRITQFVALAARDEEKTPVVRDEKTGKEYGCMGIVIPYSEAMARILDEMTPQQQWNLLVDMSMTIRLLR